jgi:glutathione-specific gamma-glutamylcyclotransferase
VSGPWIFGYGSLVWRPAIPFDEARPARIVDFVRRFWQGSTDHRGIPAAPGRVVTLVPTPGATVVGRAFRLPGDRAADILARLDHREKGGYRREEVELLPLDGDRPFARGIVYMATPDNPNYLGPAPVAALAAEVVRGVGPSGENVEYVLRLHDALQAWDAVDPHLEALAREVRRRIAPAPRHPG